jgi:hypothetical protein
VTYIGHPNSDKGHTTTSHALLLRYYVGTYKNMSSKITFTHN